MSTQASFPNNKDRDFDVALGARVRALRQSAAMSQTQLAVRLGVSFQQVQKYEKGSDRIAASTLSRIAPALGVSPGDMFAPADEVPADLPPADVREIMAVASRIARIADRGVRSRIIALADELAPEGAPPAPAHPRRRASSRRLARPSARA